MRQQVIGMLMLLLTALIWGTAFVAQQVGMDHLGPCAFNGVRSFIGALALLPAIAFFDWRAGRKPSLLACKTELERKMLLWGGLCCGVVLTMASLSQQIGIAYTTVGKSGFLTALYIVIVPVMGLFLGRKCGWLIWGCVLLSLLGLYLLCFKSTDLSVNKGDVAVFASAFLFSLHIMVIDFFAPQVDCVRMSQIQFLVAGVLSMVLALCLETFTLEAVLRSLRPLLYVGVLSSGVAYTLQIVAQSKVQPVVASLLMSLESVFASLSGWLFLHERMSARELCGCALIFLAILAAQIPLPAGQAKQKK